ncbi:MAG: peptidoglycan-binding protein, partial [Patescibacteria group bacterium]
MSKLLKSKFLLGVFVLAIVFVGVAVVSDSASAQACTITKTLRVGSKGDEVKCLQAAVGVSADGSFGPITKAAVQTWQTSKGLVADGIFGAKSRAAFSGGTVSTGTSTGALCPNGMTLASNCATSPTPAATVTLCPNGMTLASNCATSPTGAAVPTTGSVTVSLASDNPAAGTLLIDNTTGVMQNAAPVAKFVFSNGTGAEVKVNTVKLTRKGIAADGDINNLFLYEGTTKVAELSSVATKVFAFNNSSGLFSIPANSSKAIWVGINMAVATSGPTSIGFAIDSASDVVVSSGTTVGGSFPVKSNEFLTAFITDLGYIDLTSTTTFPATLDPKPEAQEVWRFTATANSQKMTLKRIVMTLVGTTSPGDIQDLTLSVGG